jgi:hypothetical protein
MALVPEVRRANTAVAPPATERATTKARAGKKAAAKKRPSEAVQIGRAALQEVEQGAAVEGLESMVDASERLGPFYDNELVGIP